MKKIEKLAGEERRDDFWRWLYAQLGEYITMLALPRPSFVKLYCAYVGTLLQSPSSPQQVTRSLCALSTSANTLLLPNQSIGGRGVGRGSGSHPPPPRFYCPQCFQTKFEDTGSVCDQCSTPLTGL
jgi:hypothetical protein